MENTNKCAHNICNCSVRDNEKYCSDHCKDAAEQDLVEITCDCGHTVCQ